MNAIPEEWIKRYIDQLLAAAKVLPEGGFKTSILLRAEHAMDMIGMWQESSQGQQTSEPK